MMRFRAVGEGSPGSRRRDFLGSHLPKNLKLGGRIRGTLGDLDPLNKVPFLREPEVGLRRVPFKGSP